MAGRKRRQRRGERGGGAGGEDKNEKLETGRRGLGRAEILGGKREKAAGRGSPGRIALLFVCLLCKENAFMVARFFSRHCVIAGT